jgi:hypothetical protein
MELARMRGVKRRGIARKSLRSILDDFSLILPDKINRDEGG